MVGGRDKKRKEKKVVRSYVRVMTVAAQTRQRMRGDNGLQEVNEDKTKVQLQLLQDTYS